jgi:BlaI family transcriptional regulator, penicillinase repressor
MNIKTTKKDLPVISEAEFEVVDVLWTKEKKMSAIEIIDELKEKQTWSPKTVKTMLFRLVKKGILDFEENRREYFYFPKFQKSEYLEKEGESFLKKLFNGATSPMLVHFLSNSKLSKKDIVEIKNLIHQIEKDSI